MKHFNDAALCDGTASSRILLTCPKFIPPYLAAELEARGYPVHEITTAGVATHGTLHDAYALNLHIRTAHRVLFQLRKFYVRTPDDLFKSLSTIAWEEIIPADGYLSVVSSVDTPSINNSMFANMKCKDAIVDRIRSKRGRRPDSGADVGKGAVVFVYWSNKQCFIYLDTSGESLSKRGYRMMPWKAPVRESLAAAMLMATRWDAASALVNPMCGSGTIAIEAAQMALHQAPGILRTNYAFMHLAGYSAAIWQGLVREAQASAHAEVSSPIIATDISDEAIHAAMHNAEAAGVAQHIRFHVCDIAATEVPTVSDLHAHCGAHPIVILNPAYGDRLGDETVLEDTYKRIGDFFKQQCSGYTGYVFTGNMQLGKKVGLKTSRRIEFYNSDIECRLLEYELYSGTRRISKDMA